MRGTSPIDPAACQYGAATAAVRQILTEWMAIDWFAPPERGADAGATVLFEEHHRRARAHAPDLFTAEPIVWTTHGDFAAFVGYSAQVRTSAKWDWKYAALKPLSHRHSEARGWSLRRGAQAQGAAHAPSLEAGQGPGPGHLFVAFGDSLIWCDIGPRLPIRDVLPKDHAEAAVFYLSYASMDALACLEWQLAEPSADLLKDNPFLPLLRCYAAGFYPFALDPGTVALFALR